MVLKQKATTIRIPLSTMRQLKQLKRHPREAWYEVIDKLIEEQEKREEK